MTNEDNTTDSDMVYVIMWQDIFHDRPARILGIYRQHDDAIAAINAYKDEHEEYAFWLVNHWLN